MQYQVPQFIEVEDKIFGPLTAKQFVYVAGGGGFALAMWLMLPLWAAILIGGPVLGLGLALAFYKINERPFINMMESAFQYLVSKKLYIWEKKKTPVPSAGDIVLASDEKEDLTQLVPHATGSRIKDLAWSLDIKESIYTNRNQQK